MNKMVRVGYHRVSDDSVSSAYLAATEADARIAECKADGDIDHVWTRDAADNVDWEWFGETRRERFVVNHGGTAHEFIWTDGTESVHHVNSGEWFGKIDPFGKVRFSGPIEARKWVTENMIYVAIKSFIVPDFPPVTPADFDTTVADGEVFTQTDDDMPAEMPCPTCYHGEFSLDPNDYPMRKVTGTFVTRGADPTTAYNLECGHSTIDL